MAKPYQIIANLLALFAIAYVGVDTFYRSLHINNVPHVVLGTVGAPPPKARQQAVVTNYELIKKRNIFGVTESPREEALHKVPDIDTLAPTTLRLTLLGTVAAMNEGSRAIIRDDITKQQNIYRYGDTIQNAVIKNILRGKVILRAGERDEILIMKENNKAPSRKNAPRFSKFSKSRGRTITNITLQRSDIEQMRDNLSELLTETTVLPYIRSGKNIGVIFTRLKRGSGVEKLGLQKGDIITTINNKAVKEISDVILLYEKLKSGGMVSVIMIRRGKEQQINYTLK